MSPRSFEVSWITPLRMNLRQACKWWKVWLRRKGDGGEGFRFGEKELDLQQTVELATKGLEASNLGRSAFKHLSAGFAGCNVAILTNSWPGS